MERKKTILLGRCSEKMKHPKINILLSEVLQENIIMNPFNEKLLKKAKKKISYFLERHLKKIFELLHLFTGLEWNRKEVKVWLFSGMHESIADPFLLNVSEDDDFVIFEFIRLLTENLFYDNWSVFNFMKKKFNIDFSELEPICYLIAEQIYKNLFGEKKSRAVVEISKRDGFNEHIWIKAYELNSKLKIDEMNLPKILKKKEREMQFYLLQ